MMKIGINALSIVPHKIGGGEVYLTNLVENLAKLDKINSYTLFVASWNEKVFRVSQDNFSRIRCSLPEGRTVYRMLYEQLILPILVRKYRLDLLHSPANYLPLLNRGVNVLTIQHLINYYHPRFFPTWKRAIYNPLVERSALKANIVIANSESTNQQISRRLGIPAIKVRTVYHGKSSVFRPMDPGAVVKELQETYGISEDYILMVSTKNPHKNPIEIVRAFAYLKSKWGNNLKLVQVGLKSAHHEMMMGQLEQLRMTGDVMNMGFIPPDKMPLLYNGARALVFPSIGEDFGLPIVEAMSCGCPVVTSNIYAPPEIAGSAGMIVNPYDYREIGEALYSILSKPELRGELVRNGLERAKAFSWEAAAMKTLAAYEDALAKAVM